MAEVTGFTADKMRIIENETVVDGAVQGDNLILMTREGVPIDAGNVRGPIGPQGIPGPVQSINDQTGAVFTPRTFATKAALDTGWTTPPDGATAYTIAEQTDWVRVLGSWQIAPQHRIFVNETERNTKWPTPPVGALCQAPAGVWWIWISGRWTPIKTGTPSIWATIPEMVVISGSAGTSAANPRTLGIGTAYRSWKAPFNSGATFLNISEAGIYSAQMTIRTKAWWALYIGIRVVRAGATVSQMIVDFARGTWGNPPGVTGFDPAYVQNVSVVHVFTAQPEDAITIIGYTNGGGDLTSTAGGGGSTIEARQIRNDLQHETATGPLLKTVSPLAQSASDFSAPIHYIRRPGYPETYPSGETDE